MKALKITYRTLLFVFLTALTQTGGIAYLIALASYKKIEHKFPKRAIRATMKLSVFLAIHLLSVFAIVPLAAKLAGRVPLPITQIEGLKPLTVWTVLLNRHYVTPGLHEAAFEVSSKMQEEYPGTVLNYLDANFPFFDGFPLLPHLSHNDGKKLDLAFYYTDNSSGNPVNGSPSFIGYGICEEPREGEVNKPAQCEESGYWQYNLLEKLVPQGSKKDYEFDVKRTKHLVQLFATHPSIGKIFIEPHLQGRLGLASSKIRFHGCHAVRHDDHLHVQLK